MILGLLKLVIRLINDNDIGRGAGSLSLSGAFGVPMGKRCGSRNISIRDPSMHSAATKISIIGSDKTGFCVVAIDFDFDSDF
jgi:hypothetical protein